MDTQPPIPPLDIEIAPCGTSENVTGAACAMVEILTGIVSVLTPDSI